MWIEKPPMRRPDSVNWADLVADAAILQTQEKGLPGLRASALARRVQVTPQALLNRYGSANNIMMIATLTLANRWEAWIYRREGTDLRDPTTALHGQLTRLIPTTEQEIEDIRAWSAIRSFALHSGDSHTELAEIARTSDAAERLRVEQCLGRFLGEPPAQAAVEILTACAAGLRERVLDAEQPLDPQAAHDALILAIDRLLKDSRSDVSS